jgi:hypothetical protein
MEPYKRALVILLMLASHSITTNAEGTISDTSENEQTGSLNTSNVDSTNNSHNTTEDNSVSTTYSGAGSSSSIPASTAVSPSYLSNGQDTCLIGTGTSIQTVGVGLSRGSYKVDSNCERRKDAKALFDLSMKVAAVALMCTDPLVFRAMMNSGTPCPLLHNSRLVVGKRAYLLMKMSPETYIPDYGPDTEDYYKKLLQIGEETNETEDPDNLTVSDMFRSSIK